MIIVDYYCINEKQINITGGIWVHGMGVIADRVHRADISECYGIIIALHIGVIL